MKTVRRGLAALSAVALTLGGAACSKEEAPAPQSKARVDVSIEPVEVVQAKLPPPAILANYGTTVAVNQYIEARFLTEVLTTTDFAKADEMGVQTSLMEAMIAWDDAEAVSADAAALAATVEDTLGEPDRKSASDRRNRDRDLAPWTDPFTRPFDPTEIVRAQSDLLTDVRDDIDAMTDAVAEIGTIINNPGDISDRDWRDVERIAEDINELPIVDLLVASTALPGGGSIGELSGSDVRGRTSDRVVLTGVDAIAMVGPRSSSVLVGGNKQVVVEEQDLPSDANEVQMVLGLVDLSPDTNINVKKDVPNVAFPIGSTPSSWLLASTLLSIQIDGALAEPTLTLAEIPLGSENAEQEALNALGVPMRDAPNLTLVELVEVIWIDPAEAIQVIDDMFEDLAPEPEKPKEEPPKKEPAPEEPAAPSALPVAGSYAWSSHGEHGDTGGQATVSLEGGSMTINFDGGVWMGTYDSNANTFVGYDAGFQMTLYFYQSGGTVVAEGEVVDDFSRDILYLSKVG